IQVVGGYSVSGNAHLGSSPATHAAAAADPLASLPVPGGGTSYAAVNLAGNSSLTIHPGVYPSITVSGTASLTPEPGSDALTGSGFPVGGNGSVSGSGVLIYNGASGTISLGGNGAIRLSAQAGGTYAGVLIFQARSNTHPLALSGNTGG